MESCHLEVEWRNEHILYVSISPYFLCLPVPFHPSLFLFQPLPLLFSSQAAFPSHLFLSFSLCLLLSLPLCPLPLSLSVSLSSTFFSLCLSLTLLTYALVFTPPPPSPIKLMQQLCLLLLGQSPDDIPTLKKYNSTSHESAPQTAFNRLLLKRRHQCTVSCCVIHLSYVFITKCIFIVQCHTYNTHVACWTCCHIEH